MSTIIATSIVVPDCPPPVVLTTLTPVSTVTTTASILACELPTQDDTVAATLPRKRRRRAPATGAADDCFACSNKGVKCDRRRPYCSPCLALGKECSGYQMQLTWGVGVASRGKLRGLSTPVIQSKPSIAPETVNAVTTTRPHPIPSTSPKKPVSPVSPAHARVRGRRIPAAIKTGLASTSWRPQPSQGISTNVRTRSASMQTADITTYDFFNMDSARSATFVSLHSAGLHSPGMPSPGLDPAPTTYEHMGRLRSPAESIQSQCPPYMDQARWSFETPMPSSINSEFGLSTSLSSNSGFSDGEIASSLDFPPTSEHVSFAPTPFMYHGEFFAPPAPPAPPPPPPPSQPPQLHYLQQRQQQEHEQHQQQQQQYQQPLQAMQLWSPERTSPTFYQRRAPTSFPELHPSAPSMCSSLSSNPSSYGPAEDSCYGSDREQQPQPIQQIRHGRPAQPQQSPQQYYWNYPRKLSYQAQVPQSEPQWYYHRNQSISHCQPSDMMFDDESSPASSPHTSDIDVGFGCVASSDLLARIIY